MVSKPRVRHVKRKVPRKRLSAVQRIVERAEDRFDNREADRIRSDPESRQRTPWEQVKKELGF
jgi:hypothetical protein